MSGVAWTGNHSVLFCGRPGDYSGGGSALLNGRTVFTAEGVFFCREHTGTDGYGGTVQW